jgi:1-acyl-sn-glycerol-3-phosphate acyltransferase
MRRAVMIYRSAVALVLFAFFALGGLLVSPLMIVLRSPRLCQPIVRNLWVMLVWLFKALGIIGVEFPCKIKNLRGCIIAANHPSLIDVVLVTVLFPRTLYVAKTALLKNPFLSAIVRHTSLPVDERLVEAVVPYLNDGWNVLVFPEGTRSAPTGQMREFHRGVAQLLLRTSSSLACLGINVSRTILSKNQKPWDMDEKRVVYSFRVDSPTSHVPDNARALRPQAIALTNEIRRRIDNLRTTVHN